MKKFVETDKYGQLYIDRIFFESYFPVLFSCQNDVGEVFICVCAQNNESGCKWLIGKTERKSIVRMLKDEITIRELFLKYSSGRISVDYVNGEYATEYNNSDWNEDSIYLPKEGSYIMAEEGEFDEDISYFLSFSQIHLQYDTDFYNDILSAAEQYVDAAASLGNMMISSTMVSMLKSFGEFCIDLSMKTEKYDSHEKYQVVFDNSFNASADDWSLIVSAGDNSIADAA